MIIKVTKVDKYAFEGKTGDGVRITGCFTVKVKPNLECVVEQIVDVWTEGACPERVSSQAYDFHQLAVQIEMLGNMGEWVRDYEEKGKS